MDKPNKKKVLIVDDEPNVRELVQRLLSRDYVVFEAHDGEMAVNIARSQKPDLILMDMMMPGIDGLAACNTIKTDPDTGNILVVMLTAVGYELNKRIAEELMGADGYITKPFDSHVLLDKVSQLLNSRQVRAG